MMNSEEVFVQNLVIMLKINVMFGLLIVIMNLLAENSKIGQNLKKKLKQMKL